MPDRLCGILGLCRKAGRLELGYDAVMDAVNAGRAALVLIAEDCSERTSGGAAKLAGEHKTEIRKLPMDMDGIGRALSKRAGVIAVCVLLTSSLSDAFGHRRAMIVSLGASAATTLAAALAPDWTSLVAARALAAVCAPAVAAPASQAVRD